MLSLLQTEFMKLKRKPVILIALLSSMLPPFINVLYTFNLPANSDINNSFRAFYQSSFTFTEWILLPCLLGAVGSILFFSEKENDTLKELMVIPLNKPMFLLSKFIMLVIFSTLFMILTALFTVIGALVFDYTDMTTSLVFRLFKISAETGILTAFSMQPLIFIVIASKKDYILPTCSTLIYSISGMIFSSQLAGIHPLSSIYGIVWSRSLKSFSVNTSLEIYILNIAVIFAISFAASAFLLKKQSY